MDNIFSELNKLTNTMSLHPNRIFRGQGDSTWGLQPSFARIVGPKGRSLDRSQALQLEREGINKFGISSRAILPLEYTAGLFQGGSVDFSGTRSLMQHFSAPTRLLDWTISPWVALYFACWELSDVSGAIFIVDFEKVSEYTRKKLNGILNKNFSKYVDGHRDQSIHIELNNFFGKNVDINNEEYLRSELFHHLCDTNNCEDLCSLTMALNSNERIESQQGRFSVCTNPLVDHSDIFIAADALTKIEISAEVKRVAMIKLNAMNINAKSLFPGADGLGRSIKEFYQYWDKDSRIV